MLKAISFFKVSTSMVFCRYKKWDSSGELVEQQTEPAEDMLDLIQAQRDFYGSHYWTGTDKYNEG